MVFWGQIQNYMMRINLSILIVAMVKETTPDNQTESQNVSITCLENRNWTLGADNDVTKMSNRHLLSVNPVYNTY